MKKSILLLLLALFGLVEHAKAQDEQHVHSGVLLELGLHSRIGYHHALPLGFVVGTHIGYELHTNPIGFLAKEAPGDFIAEKALLEFTFPMLLPSASLELRWYTGKEKSEDEINKGFYLLASGSVYSHLGGAIFDARYRGPWDYRWATKAGLGYQYPLSDVLYSKIEVGGQFSFPIPGGSGREYLFPYADFGIGIKL